MGRNSSVSPVRSDRSPRRRSPSRRERSPARDKGKPPVNHRSSNADRLSSRTRSPKRGRSKSPASHSPVREKLHSRTKSPNPRKSPSRSPVKQKTSSRAKSPNHEKSRSSPPLSPRSRRLKRAKSERDTGKESEREHEKNHNKKSDTAAREVKELARDLPVEKKERRPGRDAADNGPRSRHEHSHSPSNRHHRAAREEKELDTDLPVEKKERRSGRDAAGNGSRSRHEHSHSPSDRHHRGQRRSRSPSTADNRGRNELTNSRDDEQRNEESEALAKMRAVEESLEAKEKHKPSFELSGKLAAETNRVRGVTLLFNEPPDARKPETRWRLYVFKNGEPLNEPLYVHRQSFYLFGRERRVADIPTDHPSCSKQHAVLQYRQVEEENPDGTMSKRVRPYLMDLGSTNGTFINDEQMEPQRYYELFEKDTIKFGNSSREYVLLHENSAS